MTPVLLVSEFFPPEPGGIQRSLDLLRPAFGADVFVITPVAQTAYPGLRRSLFSGWIAPHWLWLVREFWHRAHGGRRLVIFGHYSAAVMAAWLLRPFGVRYIILAHGNDVLTELKRPLREFVGAHLRGAEWVGVNSTWLADRLHQFGVPRSRLVKTHPAVADDEGQGMARARTKLTLLTIARLVPRKNVDVVLEVVASLHAEFPELQYDVVGDGPERQTLEAKAQALGLGKVVTWHGQTDDAKRRELLQSASVFVLLPTIRNEGADVEGLGAVYLEAGAAGVPIVASRTGGIPDAVIDGVTGMLVAPDKPAEIHQALRQLLASPPLRHKYGQAGRAHIDREFRASQRTGRARMMFSGVPAEEQTKISVIIPVFNSSATIVATLNSIFTQTWTNYEVIMVDDGSTDDLVRVIAPFQDRLTLIKQANGGAPAARNRGADAAIGQFLLFVDSDSTLESDVLMTMAVALLTHPDAGYVYSDFKFGWKDFHLFDFSAERLRQTNYIHTTSLLRREIFPNFDESLKRFQDWDLWLTLLAQGQQGLWIPRQLFRVQDTGTMSRWLPSFVYQLPGIGQGRGSGNIRRYRAAEAIIRQKHGLV